MPDALQAHVGVVNEAFLALGGKSLQSFENEDDTYRAYTTIIGDVLEHLAFPFAVQRVQLNRLGAEPESGYDYNFRSPVGGDIAAVYRDADCQTPFHDYRILSGLVNTDLEEAWAEVFVGTTPDQWPSYVRLAIVGCIKADFCVLLTGDSREADRLMRLARGGPGEFPYGGLVGAARTRASQQQGGGQISLGADPLTSARYR